MPPTDLERVARAVCSNQGLQLVARVGKGGFKETFEVSSADGKRKALKVFRPDVPPDRTRREIDAMQRCDHPNIAKLEMISTISLSDQRFVYVLEEFVAGGTLNSRLGRRGLLSTDEALELCARLIDAISHIASRGLVHRDIKPDNILLRADGATPVITDFGVVRALGDTSLTPTWAPSGPGTPLYSSPEQLNNEKNQIDWRADQFSLGVVICVCTFGCHPYGGERSSPHEIVETVARRGSHAAWFVAGAARRGLPVLAKMTAGWPVERLRTPADLAAAWVAQKGQ